MTPEEEDDELVRLVYEGWAKEPMPPPERMELFEKTAHDYNQWRRFLDPTGKATDEMLSKKKFDEMSIEDRIGIQVAVSKILNRTQSRN